MKHKSYRSGLSGLAQIGALIAAALPMKMLYAIGWGIGIFVYIILAKERRKVLKHLKFAYRDTLSDKDLKKIGRKVFVNLAFTVTEMLKMNVRSIKFVSEKVLIRDEDRKTVLEERKRGHGVIFASAHIGNWEALAAYLGYAFAGDQPMVVIAKRIYYEGYNKMLVELRERLSVKTIYRDESFMQVARHLKKGGCLGIVTDQDISSIPGVFVTFFGHETFTPDAPAKLSLITGASIIPAFIVREERGLRFVIDKPIHSDGTKDRDSEALRITQEIASATERIIRRYPDQWAWMHRRWKTQPEDLSDGSQSEIKV
jgi:KDO2-lipid IV(A) lauroyltransferase